MFSGHSIRKKGRKKTLRISGVLIFKRCHRDYTGDFFFISH